MDRRRQIGRLGERIAAERLERLGYSIVERNFQAREGEIDLIAHRGDLLVFCEVKALVARPQAARGPAYPLESIGPAKRAQVRRLARGWLSERTRAARWRFRHVRFDAIGVLLSADGELVRFEHVEAAF